MGVLHRLFQPEPPMNVYDFDNTIYAGDSSLDFYRFALARRPALVFLLPLQLWGIAAYLLRLWSKEQMKSAFFCFIRYIPLDATLKRFWKRNARKIKPWYLEQKRGDDLIISASPEFLLEPAAREYLRCALIASRVDPKTSAYNGKNCYGEEKLRRFRERYGEEKIDKFYSDSPSDFPLVKIAEQSFMVKRNRLLPWQTIDNSIFAKIKRTYLSRDFILFVFCGGMGTLTNFICSLLISTVLDPSLSYICGYCLSLLVAYTLNAKLIFHSPLAFIALVKFVISYIPNFLILFGFVLVFLNIAGWNKIIVYGLAGLLGLPITFMLVKIIAFRNINIRNKKE
jgi:putative flippase GtrA